MVALLLVHANSSRPKLHSVLAFAHPLFRRGTIQVPGTRQSVRQKNVAQLTLKNIARITAGKARCAPRSTAQLHQSVQAGQEEFLHGVLHPLLLPQILASVLSPKQPIAALNGSPHTTSPASPVPRVTNS